MLSMEPGKDSTNPLDWRHYSLAVLVLAVLATWGARETIHTKRLESANETIASYDEKLTEQDHKIATMTSEHQRELTRAVTKARQRHEKRLPDGTVEITESESEMTNEQARDQGRQQAYEEYGHQVEMAKRNEERALQRLSEIESKLTRSAPKWAASFAWDPYGASPGERWRAGGGLAFGTLAALATLAPAAAIGTPGDALDILKATRPQLEAVLLF